MREIFGALFQSEVEIPLRMRELGPAQEGGSARERESERAVQLDSGAGTDSLDSGPEHKDFEIRLRVDQNVGAGWLDL